MTALALEVNDAGLVLLREGEGRPRPDSPGLAFFEGNAVRVGADAAAHARILPRAVHDRFWDAFGEETLRPPFPTGLRTVDLAHAHLRALREGVAEAPLEAFLAVPGYWSREALGLLLSASRSAGFPVSGLVDSAVAGATYFARGDEILHLELTLHRCVLTTLRAGSEVERVRVIDNAGPGQQAFDRALVDAVARRFVQETRFDPLHSGASEQALAVALPRWLLELRRAESTTARLTAGRRDHEVELLREPLASALDPLFRTLLQQVAAERGGPHTVLLVSARAARLPGLLGRLAADEGLDVVELPPDAAVAATLRLRDRIRHDGEALPFVTRLPRPGHAPAPRGGRRPTHLMKGGVAHVLGEGLTLGTAPPAGRRGLGLREAGVKPHHCSIVVEGSEVLLELVPGADTLLNGAPATDGVSLRAGDRLTLGGVQMELVAVEGAE